MTIGVDEHPGLDPQPIDGDAERGILATTTIQKAAFISAARRWFDSERRMMEQAQTLANLYADLGLAGSGLVDADFTGENAGILAVDFQAAIGGAGSILAAFTPAIRAQLNKVGFGAP